MRISWWFGIFRNKLCRKFAEAINKDSRPDLTPIRVKDLYDMEYVEAVFPKYVITDANFFRILHFCICGDILSFYQWCLCGTFLLSLLDIIASHNIDSKVKGKSVPLHAMETHERSVCIVPCILHRGIRRRWVVSFMLRPLYLQGKTPGVGIL